ncbi:MAG: trigger factor, partial [Chitinophagaceae bacterium]
MSNVLNRTIVNPHHEIIQVTVKAQNIFPNFEKQLKEYAKKAEMPGFRKGMVPFSLVKKMYGAGMFTREIYDSAEKQLMDFIKESKLDILGQPLLSKIPENTSDFNQKDATYCFEFEIGLKPSAILPELEKASFVQYKINATEKMIADNIKRLRQEYGKGISLEIVENEDNIIDFILAEEEKKHVAQVKIFTTAFQEKLRKKKVGDYIDFVPNQDIEENSQHVFQSWNIPDVQATESCILTIKKISSRVDPASLDKEFFDKVYPNQNIETEEAFKQKIKEETEQYFSQQVTHQFQHQLEHFFMDNT